MTQPPPAPPPERYKLLIEPRCIRRGRFLRRRHDYPIQNAPFELILVATNWGDRVFPGATITGVEIKSGEGAVVRHSFSAEFATGPLNPNQSRELVIGLASTVLQGGVWVHCVVKPAADNYLVDTFQRDRTTAEVAPSGSVNEWGDAWFIQDQAGLLQSRTNFWLLIIALLTLLQGVFGLGDIAHSFVHALGSFFVWLGHLLGAGT